MRTSRTVIISILFLSSSLCPAEAFTLLPRHYVQIILFCHSAILQPQRKRRCQWISTDETYDKLDDWKSQMQSRKDGSLWSSFIPTPENEESNTSTNTASASTGDVDPKLDVLASVAADEIDFINTPKQTVTIKCVKCKNGGSKPRRFKIPSI